MLQTRNFVSDDFCILGGILLDDCRWGNSQGHGRAGPQHPGVSEGLYPLFGCEVSFTDSCVWVLGSPQVELFVGKWWDL